jgi:hypothetical protein
MEFIVTITELLNATFIVEIEHFFNPPELLGFRTLSIARYSKNYIENH